MPFWQRGYGVLTLGERQRATAENYVRRQTEHHTQHTTNSWLERVNEFDEGPPDQGLPAGGSGAKLREAAGEYGASPDGSTSPFPF